MPTQQYGVTNYVGTFNYTMAAPSGDSKDFASNYSWLGFTLEGDWFMRQNLSTGFILGWQEIYKEQNGDSFQFDNGTATGRTYRHSDGDSASRACPILGREPRQAVPPVRRDRRGTYWMKQTVDFGIYTADVDHWHFGLAPRSAC